MRCLLPSCLLSKESQTYANLTSRTTSVIHGVNNSLWIIRRKSLRGSTCYVCWLTTVCNAQLLFALIVHVGMRAAVWLSVLSDHSTSCQEFIRRSGEGSPAIHHSDGCVTGHQRTPHS